MKLESPALGDAPIAWKMDDSGDPRALRASTDDSQWENAPVSETGETGRAGKPAVLRHTILVQETRLFPAPLPALFIAGGGIQPVTFTAFGLPGKTLREWNIYLELPEAVEAIGASGYYGSRDKKPRFSLHPEKPGSGNPRYRVEASQPVAARAPGSPVILSVFDVALRQKEAAAAASPENAVLRYFGRANANTVSELAQNTPLRLLPKLRGRQFKNLTFQLWGSYTLNLDDPEIRDALLSTARAAGFNDFVGIPGSEAGKFGLTSTLLVNFKSHSLDLAPWLREHPEDRLINARGQPEDSLLCTTVLLASGWKEAGAPLLEQWWERRKPDTVNYDYEYPPFRGPHSCYCPRCLEAFRKAAGLDPAEPLDPSKIQEKYAAQWVDFMARRVAALFLLMKNTVHELPGKVKFEAYSGYQTPDNAAKYGVDWRHVGELHAVDRAGVGYGRPIPGIAETLRALPGIPVLFGELVTPYLTNQRLDGTRPVHPVTKAALLRRFIDSGGGALVYNTQNMEGRSWFAAAETSRLVAEYEAFFGDGKATPLPGQPEEEVRLLQKEGGSLVCVMNPGRVEKTYAFPLDPALGGGREFYSGQAVQAGETIRLTLPAGESAVYILNKQ